MLRLLDVYVTGDIENRQSKVNMMGLYSVCILGMTFNTDGYSGVILRAAIPDGSFGRKDQHSFAISC